MPEQLRFVTERELPALLQQIPAQRLFSDQRMMSTPWRFAEPPRQTFAVVWIYFAEAVGLEEGFERLLAGGDQTFAGRTGDHAARCEFGELFWVQAEELAQDLARVLPKRRS